MDTEFKQNGGIENMELETAKKLKYGDIIYFYDGIRERPYRIKVLSIKTWKRNPNRIFISGKYGLYEYPKFNETDLERLKI